MAGWKPIPLSLKILFVIITLWVIGTFMNISARYESGIPFFGLYLYGLTAGVVVLLLDIIGPITFLTGLWKRKSWAVPVAFTYMTIFILNSIVALFTVREQFGLAQILMPALFTIIFLAVIYTKRIYFK